MNGRAGIASQHSQTQSQHRSSNSMNGRIGLNGRVRDQSEPVAMPVGGIQSLPKAHNDPNLAMLGAARSPPKNKNTSHVPCKFYLQNQCQAGRMCPFSHDLESSTRPTPCKYFAKGHCKFGAKCALLHITPDGVVVNRRQFQPTFSNENQMFTAYPTPPGLLSLQAQGYPQAMNGHGDHVKEVQNGFDMPLDYATASPPFGSPNQHERIATSPPQKGLSVLDAPLPNSFDSNGISMAARNGPFAASMPSRFGLESPPSSLPRQPVLGNVAVQELHTSAFGDGNMDSVLAGSSPPKAAEPLTFPKRSLYSERLRASRPVMSASVGARPPQAFGSDDEADTDQEESLLPASLRDLIPEGRSRRGSRAAIEESPASFLAAQRRTLSSNTTPQESKVGSPAFGSSPSRYSGIFAQRSVSSDFIGSPLRNSGFAGSSPPFRHTSGDLSPSVSSPPRQATMSALTQDLQRTKLDSTRLSTQALPSGPVRTLSNGSNGRKSLDRNLSSASFGRERIEEEQELFDMEEIGAPAKNGINHGAIGSHRHK